MTKKKYSSKIGFLKSVKNILITMGIPALVILADHWTEWIPKEYYSVAIPVMGFISYFVKNYVQNK